MSWVAACEAVRQTISLYCQLLDDQRFAELGQLFCEDGELPWEGRTLRGRDEILRGLPSTQQPLGLTRHLPFGSVIDVQGQKAWAWTDTVVTLNQVDGPVTIAWIGRYHDRLALVDDRWCFKSHVAVAVGEPIPDGVVPVSLDALQNQADVAP
jgi:hypothetical protein